MASPRGKLKIFLGYAAGVGKTYAMLEAARQRLDEGLDVVIGDIETHQRAEMEAFVVRLEIIPRKSAEYSGVTFPEMDVDAILARHPKLALVDELAHTNAPGSRHPRRYQDVKELLDAGIDVYTTLNIQHLESLSDVVSQITGVRRLEYLEIPTPAGDYNHALHVDHPEAPSLLEQYLVKPEPKLGGAPQETEKPKDVE